jgi:hypothetical protein
MIDEEGDKTIKNQQIKYNKIRFSLARQQK